jgi:hypothetical protein
MRRVRLPGRFNELSDRVCCGDAVSKRLQLARDTPFAAPDLQCLPVPLAEICNESLAIRPEGIVLG